MTIHVFVVDDEEIWVDGIRWLIGKEHDQDVVGSALTTEEMMSCVKAHLEVDVVLLDIMLGKDNGLDLIKPIRTGWPTAKIVMMTSVDSGQSVMDSLREGACDYVVKTDFDDLPDAVRAAVAGEEGMHRSAAGAIKRELARQSRVELTPHEKSFLTMVLQGRSTNQMTEAMGIEEGTLRNYVTHINRKLGTITRKQAAMKAHELGLLD